MAVLYPSQEWCDAWKEALNNDEALAEKGKNWGVDFNGNWLFVLEPSGGLEKTVYIYLEAREGKAGDVRMIDDPSSVEAGFMAIGSYADYKAVVKGEKDLLQGVMTGSFKLKGNMAKVMRNAKFIRAVANSISRFEADYLGG
jgi:putative sterol carrier protein